MTVTLLDNKAAAALKRWHEMFAARDLAALPDLIHPDAVFRSPVAHTPYKGRDALVVALSTVINVFENFTYHREFATEDGRDVVLEFSAEVGGKKLKGADFIKFNEDGLIVEFEVMIRPASGLMALGQKMGAALEGRLDKFK